MLDAAAKPSVSVNLGPSPIGAPHRESGAIPEEDKRPRVSDPALETWAAAFKKVYPDADQDFAWKSARGFFPDKQVGRDRVRALIPRPQGRPKEK